METCGNWEASGFHKLSVCKGCSSPGSHTAVQLSAHNKDLVRLVCVCVCVGDCERFAEGTKSHAKMQL